MLYFDHDTSASTDPTIMQLRLEHGGAAVDAYWYLIELMHKEEREVYVGNAGALRVHCHTLCVDDATLGSWIYSMCEIGLITCSEDEGTIESVRAMENIEKYQGKREKARSAALVKWSNANAERTQCERNAKKRKEKKRNSSNATKSITTTKAPSDAAAAKAAPTVADDSRAPHCPLCDALLLFDVKTGGWRCGTDGSIVEREVVWR